MERRFLSLPGLEVRLETRADGKPCVTGYAAVFYSAQDSGTEYQLGPGLRERVMPGCFDRMMKDPGCDVRGLFNHDPNHLLGRRSNGTLRLAVDGKGLRYEIDPPDTTAGRDVVEMLRRDGRGAGQGDLAGSSFSFAVRKQAFVSGGHLGGMAGGGLMRDDDGDDDDDVRELHDVDVYDVGPVTFPAYGSASAGLRSELPPEVRSAWQDWRAERRGAVTFQAGPTLDSDTWDGPAAEKLVRSWASQGDTQDWGKYRRAFAWYDAKDAEKLGAYKLIHHTVKDGQLVVHKKGVIAAMTALLGGRGGADLPDGDKEAVYSHLERHYKQFDMDAPDFHRSAAPPAPADTLALMRMRQRLLECD